MSLRRFLAGPISFGLTLGLAIVALLLNDWSIDPFATTALIAWGVALVLTAITLVWGWPIFHVSAAAALMVATGLMDSMAEWPLPLAAAVGTMAMGRFASTGFTSRWVSRAVGLLAVYGIVTLAYWTIQGTADLGTGGASVIELIGAFLALAVIAVMGFWHGGDDED